MDEVKAVNRTAACEALAAQLMRYVEREEWDVLRNQVADLAANPQSARLARVFAAVPRILKSADKHVRVSWDSQEWPVIRLARVWVLMHIPPLEQATYMQLIERLFQYGEMEELAALYAALPSYYYPEAWLPRCQEGIRSNMGSVRQAVMLHNPYPSRFLDEGAWNQLVLKAFFTDEDVNDIVGVNERNNLRLAEALVDYAYERHAANRAIDPMLWVLVEPFMDERGRRLREQLKTNNKE